MAEAATDLRPAPERAPTAAPPAAPSPPSPTETVVAPSSPSGSYIIVRDRFTIFCDRALPSLDMPNALAYEVADRKQEGRPLYALVCRPDMPARISVMRALKGLEITAVLHMVDWGVAEWPPLERKCVIVIYHRPLGGKVMDAHFGGAKRIPDHMFARTVIKPIAEGLIEMGRKGVTHRSIRPDNLYYIDEQKTKIVLGDCVTAVPAHDQPVLLETIESGMAQPAGRGAGNYADGTLEVWIRRGLELNDLADSIASAIKGTGAALGKGEADDIIIARVLMLLDPRAPIRYRDFRLFIEGFGSSLAVAMLRKQKLQPYTDFITRELWRYWIIAQTKFIAENQQYEGVFRELRNYLKDQNSGAGIERCVYELNEWQPCMSPLIADQYVMEVKGVLPALDAVAKTANTKVWPVDRHIGAFLRARYAKGTGSQIDAMNDPRPDRATIGMLSVLAIVQWRLGPEALYGLSQWAGGLMAPVLNSYQNRNKRKEIEKELPKLVRKGNLAEIFNYLDNPEERQRDAEGFTWAKAEYAAAEKLVYDLENGQVDRQESAILTGRQAGAAGAGFILFLVLMITLLGKLF